MLLDERVEPNDGFSGITAGRCRDRARAQVSAVEWAEGVARVWAEESAGVSAPGSDAPSALMSVSPLASESASVSPKRSRWPAAVAPGRVGLGLDVAVGVGVGATPMAVRSSVGEAPGSPVPSPNSTEETDAQQDRSEATEGEGEQRDRCGTTSPAALHRAWGVDGETRVGGLRRGRGRDIGRQFGRAVNGRCRSCCRDGGWGDRRSARSVGPFSRDGTSCGGRCDGCSWDSSRLCPRRVTVRRRNRSCAGRRWRRAPRRHEVRSRCPPM